ncbi:hypothetical protein ACLVWQ_24180 [Streptomyces sp. CWNU-52B]|uniref:hypothetical protein n=1 Tax=unclassified Streptomyces TaxID=2593676 RepID=UPI0039C443CC
MTMAACVELYRTAGDAVDRAEGETVKAKRRSRSTRVFLGAILVSCVGFGFAYAENFGAESSVKRVDEPPSVDDRPYDKVP